MKVSKALILRRDLVRWNKQVRDVLSRRLPSAHSTLTQIEVRPKYLGRADSYNLRVDKVIAQSCKNDADAALVREAFSLALEGHAGQKRRSGEPYVEHPIITAETAAEWGRSPELVAAMLCHDLIEDGEIKGQRVKQDFLKNSLGQRVAELVDGLTEPGKEDGYEGEQPSDVQILRKYLEQDLECIIGKLADRLHNMRTFATSKPESQKEKATQTLNVHRRIADILGMWELKRELEELAFPYLEPELSEEIQAKRESIKAASSGRVADIAEILRNEFAAKGQPVDVVLEKRGAYELYERMVRRNISLNDLTPSDIWRVNMVVPEGDCHRAIGVVHGLYTHDPKEYEDRINPETASANKHQFIHTYVNVPHFSAEEPSFRLLVQIRDKEMQRNYRLGILSKGGEIEPVWLDLLLKFLRTEKDMGLRDLYEKIAAVSARMVTVTTRSGRQLQFSHGSTALDFAHRINKRIFCRAKRAIINGHPAPLSQKIQDGDSVFVETDMKNCWPSLEWREWIVTEEALEGLKYALKFKLSDKGKVVKKTADEIYDSAFRYFEDQAKKHYLPARELLASAFFKSFLAARAIKDEVDFLDKVGRGEVGVKDLLSEFMMVYKAAVQKQPKEARVHRIMISAEDRSGLLDELTAPLAELGMNMSAVFSYNYEEKGKKMAMIYLSVEGVGGKAGPIQQLQIHTIVGKPREVSHITIAAPDQVRRFLKEYLRRKQI